MLQAPPLIVPRSLGWQYPFELSPLRIVDGVAACAKPFPSRALLGFDKPGRLAQVGLIDPNHRDYKKLRERFAQSLAKELTRDGTLIVYPEFGFCADLEEEARRLVDTATTDYCIVIGGSYYRPTPDGFFEIVSPVIVKGHPTYYQRKLLPAEAEKPFAKFVRRSTREIQVFSDTGFGDFAVQICSDALPERFNEESILALRGKIDFLVVVARNKSAALFENLRDIARRERWLIVYCNGDKCAGRGGSAIYTPRGDDTDVTRRGGTARSKPGRKVPEGEITPIPRQGVSLEVHKLYSDLASNKRRFRRLSDRDGFPATPRHWPWKGKHAVGFGRFLKVLALGSHFDDLWLGSLGTLMLLQERFDAQIVCASLCDMYPHPYFGRYPLKDKAARIDEASSDICNKLGFSWYSMDGSGLADRDFDHAKLSDAFGKLKRTFGDADLVFAPRGDDLNNEHRMTSQLALVHFQGCDVFEYEIKDFRRVPFNANVFVDLTPRSLKPLTLSEHEPQLGLTFAKKKAEVLEYASHRYFGALASQFQQERTIGKMTVRASENARSCAYAEAFVSEIII